MITFGMPSKAFIAMMIVTPTLADENGLMPTKDLCGNCTPLSAEWERTKDPKGEGQTLMTAICHSFINGVISYNYVLVAGGVLKATFCPPTGTIMMDIKKVFLKYCENHPEAAEYEGSLSVIVALQAVYPCKEQAK